MAVNVTEKDKTLNEIIDWCEQLAAEGLRLASALLMQHDMDASVYKHQSNRADILHTLKLKAEMQPTFDLVELNQ